MATQSCLVLNIRHLVLIVCLFKGVLVIILLGLMRPLVPTFVMIVAVSRTITIIIVAIVVAVASAILLWVALGLRLPLVIVLSLLVVFTVTRAVFSHTLTCSLHLAIDAIILHIITTTMLLILLVNI